MKITGIVSSPRRGGNSELAVKEILKRFPDDWEKSMIRLNELDIKGCTACYSCIPEGSKCRLKDDLDFVVRHVKHSDKVVIAAPAYMLGVHRSVKDVADRLISLVSDHRAFNRTDCVIVNCYGMYGWEGMVKEDTQIFARKLHLNVIAHEVMLATLPGDSVKGENLKRIQRLADLLMKGSKERPEPTSDALECPFCTSTALHIKPDGSVRCCVCAGEGKLINGTDGLKIDYDPAFNHHFTPESLDEHSEYLNSKKNLFLETRADVKAIQSAYSDLDWWVKPEGDR